MLWGSDKKKAAPNNEWVRANSAPAGVMWLFFRAKMDFWRLVGQRWKRVLLFVPCASGLGRQGQRRASRGESWDGCGQSRTGILQDHCQPSGAWCAGCVRAGRALSTHVSLFRCLRRSPAGCREVRRRWQGTRS